MKKSYSKYLGGRESVRAETIQMSSFTCHCSGQLTEASEDGLGCRIGHRDGGVQLNVS